MPQFFTFSNGQNNWKTRSIRKGRFEQHYKPPKPNRYLWNTSFSKRRLQILLKCMWSIVQDR